MTDRRSAGSLIARRVRTRDNAGSASMADVGLGRQVARRSLLSNI
jgi:hypothetical protein